MELTEEQQEMYEYIMHTINKAVGINKALLQEEIDSLVESLLKEKKIMLKDLELKAIVKSINKVYEENYSLGVLKNLGKDLVRVIEEIQEGNNVNAKMDNKHIEN